MIVTIPCYCSEEAEVMGRFLDLLGIEGVELDSENFCLEVDTNDINVANLFALVSDMVEEKKDCSRASFFSDCEADHAESDFQLKCETQELSLALSLGDPWETEF